MIRWLVLVVLAFVSVPSNAETIAATYDYQYIDNPKQWRMNGYQIWFPDQSAVCNWYESSINTHPTVRYTYGVKQVNTSFYCIGKSSSDGQEFLSPYLVNGTKPCPSGYTATADQRCKTNEKNYHCPSGGNWSLEGNNCTRPDCVAPQVRQPNGQCGTPDCTGLAGKAASTNAASGRAGEIGWKSSGTSSTSRWSGGSFGYGGCGVSCSGGVCVPLTAGSTGFNCAAYGCQYTGQPNTSTDIPDMGSQEKPTDQQQKCLSKGQGYVTINGVTTCAPVGDTGGEKYKKDTATKTDGTGTTSTTTETTQNCENGRCTVTETTTTTDGEGNTQTESKESDKDRYCEENPDSKMCKQEECEEGDTKLSCMDSGEPEDDGSELTTEEKGHTSIAQKTFASNASCPGDISLPKGMTFSWQPVCQLASSVRPIVLAFAWLFAGYFVIGALRNA